MRIKSNYQLGELIKLDDYNSFIELVAKFTVSSLQVRMQLGYDGSTCTGVLS